MTKTFNKIKLGAFLISSTTTLNLILGPIKAYGLSAIESGVLAAHSSGQPESLFGLNGIFTTTSNVLLFAIGGLSVLMIILGGIKYVISGGKEASVNKAKNTVLYAIIGLVIALLAYAIINFVLETLMPGMGNGGTNV